MSDDEHEDQLADYSTLINKKNKRSQAPKRGTKVNESDQVLQDQLTKSRQALFECISQEPSVPKNASRGQLMNVFPYYTAITQSKGTHIHSVGFSQKGVTTLYPEEAAFLISRSALAVTTDQDQPVGFEEYCEIMYEAKDGWISFEKYQVYAYLKRLGFIVMRSRDIIPTATATTEAADQAVRSEFSLWKLFYDTITRWIQPTQKPLVWNYQHTSYQNIYSTLQIIPSSPWYKPFYKSLCRSFDWDVYKPKGGWKKKNPGEPDFRIVVYSAQQPMPTLHEQNQLFSQLSLTSNAHYQPRLQHTQLKEFGPTFVIALVGDAEGISFLRITGDGLTDVSGLQLSVQKSQRRKT